MRHQQLRDSHVPLCYVLVLFNFFHVQQAVLEAEYPTRGKCEVARVQLGYAAISPLGVHGECQRVARPVPVPK